MFEVSNNKNVNKFHLVLICDETGIFDAFRIIRDNIGSTSDMFLTLVYSVPENYPNPLFKREIEILEKRFSHNFYTCTMKVEPGKYDLIQGILEAIINSNTSIKMQFLVLGNEEFADHVSEVLGYLNTDAFSITSKTF